MCIRDRCHTVTNTVDLHLLRVTLGDTGDDVRNQGPRQTVQRAATTLVVGARDAQRAVLCLFDCDGLGDVYKRQMFALIFEWGSFTSSWYAVLALRRRVKKSAMGSVMVIGRPRHLSRCGSHATPDESDRGPPAIRLGRPTCVRRRKLPHRAERMRQPRQPL